MKSRPNQELSKSGARLTRRQIDDARYKLAKQLPSILKVLNDVATGQAQASAPQVAAIGKILDRILPGITPQDLEQVTNEPKTDAEITASVATMLKDTKLLDKVIQSDCAAAIACRDYLNTKLGQGQVVPMTRPEKTASTCLAPEGVGIG